MGGRKEQAGDSGIPGLAAVLAGIVAYTLTPDPSSAVRLGTALVAASIGMVAGAILDAIFRRD